MPPLPRRGFCRPVVKEALLPLWWSLSLALASAATARYRTVGGKVAFPLMPVSVAIAHIYLAWRFL
ncbi:MAG TPA: hypothetical protein VGQ35_17505 [Dongiaceae bacterium]|nr:hypothetical protein [Dongiaceae bacterium]